MTVSFDLKMFMWSGNESCSVLSDSLRPLGLCRLPGSSTHGILHSRILEWVAISFCSESFQPRDWTWVSFIAGWPLTIRATYDYNMTGTSAKLRSCWAIDAGHHPRSRWYYCPHFFSFENCGTQREDQLPRFPRFCQECPSVQVSSLSDCSLHTGLQDAFLSPREEWNKTMGMRVKWKC